MTSFVLCGAVRRQSPFFPSLLPFSFFVHTRPLFSLPSLLSCIVCLCTPCLGFCVRGMRTSTGICRSAHWRSSRRADEEADQLVVQKTKTRSDIRTFTQQKGMTEIKAPSPHPPPFSAHLHSLHNQDAPANRTIAQNDRKKRTFSTKLDESHINLTAGLYPPFLSL